jgi:hypothetical protein
MSTKIEDLPGPIPEDVRNDLNNIEHNIRREEEIVRQNTLQNSHSQPPPPINPDLYKQAPQESNIQFNIKKRVKFRDDDQLKDAKDENPGLLTFIQDQVNEENLLLLIVLIVSSRNDLDPYIRNLPAIGNQLGDSLILITIVRCFLLLVVYIMFRQYVLPKIKV